ncbi:aldolase/citrate lyase family protein [Ramlibacter sp. XY19]|uniref:aldolase/citrate lyase family protein n=1 Tax=Ramlibacter paludis TaxID=2908000 RepID=UPI0023DCD0A6|nr:aldolase/citrate lyase family protein [Ramlibacter paludis]MCG2595230.1 aldolase/citrate lyase family protein [Ramlibacter paludis]
MLELIQITNDPAFAQRCDALGGFRLFVDLERNGKAERQAGRNTFISTHQVDDVGRVKRALRNSRLMVRVNPLHAGTAGEVDAVLAQGADLLMLPMFTTARTLREFSALVAGRAPIVPLLETAGALQSLDEWADTPGLQEIYVGLNDLHLSLGHRFMFQPLADGTVERVARAAKARGLRFGFGGIARLEEGLLPGRDVLAEHLRLGSGAVILSRTFHRDDPDVVFEHEVQALREVEAGLASRTPPQVQADARRIADAITGISAGLAARA